MQASEFYTQTIFNIFQKEVHDAVWSCSPGPVSSMEDHDICEVFEQYMGESGKNKSLFFKAYSDEFRNGKAFRFKVLIKHCYYLDIYIEAYVN